MTDPITDHYATTGLLDRILAALRTAGKDLDRLTIDDLAPIDEFHSRRRQATEELARMLAPAASDHVIDIGSGIGGPARYLARTYGCQVSGIDLTEDFVATATALTRMVGLSDRVAFRVGSALALPFPDASFDLAWTQNVAMNIADRAGWYRENPPRPPAWRAAGDPGCGARPRRRAYIPRHVGGSGRDQFPAHARGDSDLAGTGGISGPCVGR